MGGTDEGDDERVSMAEAIRLAAERGIHDPIVECHDHGVKMKLSELSPMALMALEAGLDVDGECLLLSKK